MREQAIRQMLAAALVLAAQPAAATPVGQAAPESGETLWNRFLTPPPEARPMVRWWWFGPAVTTAELDREIAAMKRGGFGGFEVQPTYPLAIDDPAGGIRNLPFLSDPFLAALRHTGATARRQGLRMDVTLGSGWPFGGAQVPITQAAAEVRQSAIAIPAGADQLTIPALPQGEYPLALFVDGERLPLPPGLTIPVRPAPTPRQAQLYVAGRTGQQVKRPAIGAEGFVIDHVSRAAVNEYLATTGDRLVSAFAPGEAPHAIFSDSLEAYGSSWTDDLPHEFERRRGYDLLDHLPALFADTPQSAAVRFDWSRTLSELVDERYLRPITTWAHAHGIRFRAQVYGFPPPTLSSNALVDLPEGEGADWRRFTSTRWATSAAHLYDRPVVSSETWTWLHSPSWAATPLDMKVEADRHFLQGVNQIVGHGWPYSSPGMAEPGWAFYAAAAISDHNPWYPAMPAVTGYLQRVSAMLRTGKPDSDVAVYLPIEDGFADMRPTRASVNEEMRERLGMDVVPQILDAGHGFDFIDGQAIVAGKLTARVLVLPGLTRIDPAALPAIQTWVRRGGLLIATGTPPSAAGGLRDGAAASRRVRGLIRTLFAKNAIVVPPSKLGDTLKRRARDGAGATRSGDRLRAPERAGRVLLSARQHRCRRRPHHGTVRGGQWPGPVVGPADRDPHGGRIRRYRAGPCRLSVTPADVRSRAGGGSDTARHARPARPAKRMDRRHRWPSGTGAGRGIVMDRRTRVAQFLRHRPLSSTHRFGAVAGGPADHARLRRGSTAAAHGHGGSTPCGDRRTRQGSGDRAGQRA
jgi:hypothetical protein